MSSGIYGTTKLKSDTSALSVKKQEQELFIKQLNSEKVFYKMLLIILMVLVLHQR